MKCCRRNLKGFTLAEAMMALVVLSIASSSVLLPFTAGAAVEAQGARRQLAVWLAGDMLEEIKASDFGDVEATYDGMAEAEGEMTGSSGNVLAGDIYKGLSRDVTCQQATVSGVDMLIVTVCVYYNSETIAEVSSLIGQ